MKIFYYKVPSYVHKVKYGKAIEDLYKAEMSGDEEENNKIKKTIANVIFGLREKGYNCKSLFCNRFSHPASAGPLSRAQKAREHPRIFNLVFSGVKPRSRIGSGARRSSWPYLMPSGADVLREAAARARPSTAAAGDEAHANGMTAAEQVAEEEELDDDELYEDYPPDFEEEETQDVYARDPQPRRNKQKKGKNGPRQNLSSSPLDYLEEEETESVSPPTRSKSRTSPSPSDHGAQDGSRSGSRGDGRHRPRGNLPPPPVFDGNTKKDAKAFKHFGCKRWTASWRSPSTSLGTTRLACDYTQHSKEKPRSTLRAFLPVRSGSPMDGRCCYTC